MVTISSATFMPDTNAATLSSADKIGEALKCSLPYLASETREVLKNVLTPEALVVIAVITASWVAAHFIGVGEAIDIILRVVHFQLAESVAASNVVGRYRLWRWIDERTVMSGTADLVLRTVGGVVVIDHKTFPGMDGAAVERASGYSGQLAAYQAAICAATGEAPGSTWVHFPVLGRVVEVCLEPANE